MKKFPLLVTHLNTQQEMIENSLSSLRQLKIQLNELRQSLWKKVHDEINNLIGIYVYDYYTAWLLFPKNKIDSGFKKIFTLNAIISYFVR